MNLQNQKFANECRVRFGSDISIAKRVKRATEAKNQRCHPHGVTHHPCENYNRRTQLNRELCNLVIIVVAEQFNVSLGDLMCKTRSKAEIARTRQIAVYLAHTTLSVSYRCAADYFKRDRTTIAHACKTVEDLRDDREFDDKLSRIEALVLETANFLYGFNASQAIEKDA